MRSSSREPKNEQKIIKKNVKKGEEVANIDYNALVLQTGPGPHPRNYTLEVFFCLPLKREPGPKRKVLFQASCFREELLIFGGCTSICHDDGQKKYLKNY